MKGCQNGIHTFKIWIHLENMVQIQQTIAVIHNECFDFLFDFIENLYSCQVHLIRLKRLWIVLIKIDSSPSSVGIGWCFPALIYFRSVDSIIVNVSWSKFFVISENFLFASSHFSIIVNSFVCWQLFFFSSSETWRKVNDESRKEEKKYDGTWMDL